VLRALGQDEAGIGAQFILIATPEGRLHGLRSTNGAPFKPYDGEAVSGPAICPAPAPPKLGCGAIIHGIGFDYDSDVIRPDSRPLIALLHEGLRARGSRSWVIPRARVQRNTTAISRSAVPSPW